MLINLLAYSFILIIHSYNNINQKYFLSFCNSLYSSKQRRKTSKLNANIWKKIIKISIFISKKTK